MSVDDRCFDIVHMPSIFPSQFTFMIIGLYRKGIVIYNKLNKYEHFTITTLLIYPQR